MKYRISKRDLERLRSRGPWRDMRPELAPPDKPLSELENAVARYRKAMAEAEDAIGGGRGGKPRRGADGRRPLHGGLAHPGRNRGPRHPLQAPLNHKPRRRPRRGATIRRTP